MNKIDEREVGIAVRSAGLTFNAVENAYWETLWLLPNACPGADEMRTKYVALEGKAHSEMVLGTQASETMSSQDRLTHIERARLHLMDIIGVMNDMEDVREEHSNSPGFKELGRVAVLWLNGSDGLDTEASGQSINQEAADALDIQFGEYESYDEYIHYRQRAITKVILDSAAHMQQGGTIDATAVDGILSMISDWNVLCAFIEDVLALSES